MPVGLPFDIAEDKTLNGITREDKFYLVAT